MRLAKYLASTGIASRRKAEELILAGKIAVNGTKTTNVASNVVGDEEIAFNGQLLKPSRKVYYLLNKPAGYTSTTLDQHAEKLVTELVPKSPPVWPVGRLDRETSGLLILTNDGELTQQLTHPKYKKEKEYEVVVDRPLSAEEQVKLKKGITLDDGPFKPDTFTETSSGKYKMQIHEGRNRLIRRSVSFFGKEIVRLKRVRIGNITISRVAEGSYRNLTAAEVKELKHA